MKKAIFFLILCLLVPLTSTYAQEAIQPDNAAKINAAKHFDKPYVILISLDGFRYDYIKKYNPPHLSAFIKNGVAAESLIPCFPSKTFPNHMVGESFAGKAWNKRLCSHAIFNKCGQVRWIVFFNVVISKAIQRN